MRGLQGRRGKGGGAPKESESTGDCEHHLNEYLNISCACAGEREPNVGAEEREIFLTGNQRGESSNFVGAATAARVSTSSEFF